MAGGELGTLNIKLAADTAQAITNISHFAASTQRQFDVLRMGAVRLTGAFLAIGGVAGIGSMIKRQIDAQDALYKTSQKVGMSVEALAGWQHAADLAGVSGEAFSKGVKGLATQMLDASMGLGEAQRNFALLDVVLKNTDGTLKSTEQLMLEVADKFAAMEDGALKSALAAKVFGRAGLDLIPMLNQGSEAIAKLIADGKLLNPVTEESAKRAEQFNDNMRILGKTVSSVGVSITNELLGPLARAAQAMEEARQRGEGFWSRMIEGAKEAMQAVMGWDAAGQLKNNTLALADAYDALKDMQTTKFGPFQTPIDPAVLRRQEDLIAELEAERVRLQATMRAVEELGKKPTAGKGGVSIVGSEEAKMAAKLAELNMAGIRTKLAQDLKMIDVAYSQGVTSLENYFTARRVAIEEGMRVELQEIAEAEQAQASIIGNKLSTAAEQAAAWFEMAKLDQRRDLAERAADVEKAILIEQERIAVLAREADAAEALAGSYTMLAESARAADEVLAQFNKTASDEAQTLEFSTALLGKSAKEQALLTLNRQIDLRTMEAAANINEENIEQMGELYAAADRAKAKARELYEAHYEVARSWQTGVREALHEYLDDVTNAAAMSKKLVVDAFKKMEDALVEFVKNGKLSFREFADAIITDIIRIQVRQQITGPLASGAGGLIASAVGALFGGGGGVDTSAPTSVPGRASGGPVFGGESYLVGERGPELFTPAGAGHISPNASGGASYYIDARGADAVKIAQLERMITAINGTVERRAVAAVAQQRIRGGSFASVFS